MDLRVHVCRTAEHHRNSAELTLAGSVDAHFVMTGLKSRQCGPRTKRTHQIPLPRPPGGDGGPRADRHILHAFQKVFAIALPTSTAEADETGLLQFFSR